MGKWRQRFVAARLAGVLDELRPGAPRTIDDEQIEDVSVRRLETTPRGATHWRTRAMAKPTGQSALTISRIWRVFGLQTHRCETIKLSPTPLLIAKVRDCRGAVLQPLAHAVVVCVAIKPQVQALDRTALLLPLRGQWSGGPMIISATAPRCSMRR